MKLKSLLKNQNAIKILVSILILLFLFKFINLNLLLTSLKDINSIFLLVLLLIPINILLRAFRLTIILNRDKKLISIKDSCYLNLAGMALNIFLPASSGDIAKSYYGYKWHGIKEEMLSANIFDKFMALFSIFFIGSIAAVFMEFYYLSIFSTIIALLFLLIFLYSKIMPWGIINQVLLKLLKIKLDKGKLASSFDLSIKIKLKTFIISIIASLVLYFQFYLICLSFSAQLSFYYVLAVSPLMNLAMLFPLTFNGLGSGEAITMYLFSLINISTTLALTISLISQIVNGLIPGFLGYLIIMRK